MDILKTLKIICMKVRKDKKDTEIKRMTYNVGEIANYGREGVRLLAS